MKKSLSAAALCCVWLSVCLCEIVHKVQKVCKKTLFISEAEGSYLELATTQLRPIIDVVFAKSKDKELPDEDINLVDFEDVKGLKAKGKRLSTNKIKEINLRPSIEEKIDATFSTEDGISKDIDFQRINSIRQQLDDLENQMTLDF
jgi:topoisomerase-4 subunit A